ncbi:hypothetical protein FOL47_002816 [Perkinsus chesapeaki]|uniref:Uncharacterized protein n=1 Tax=Perkinsus chesapeaki TaxID=330153 RepID=A0A7J6MBI7_PERCH|nr:hypothetical protein FOL47_002816 [Perkinsus chesapeaki]
MVTELVNFVAHSPSKPHTDNCAKGGSCPQYKKGNSVGRSCRRRIVSIRLEYMHRYSHRACGVRWFIASALSGQAASPPGLRLGLCGIPLSAVIRDKEGNFLPGHERFSDEEQKLTWLCPLAGNISPTRVDELRALKKKRSEAKMARRREAKRIRYQEKKRPPEEARDAEAAFIAKKARSDTASP